MASITRTDNDFDFLPSPSRASGQDGPLTWLDSMYMFQQPRQWREEPQHTERGLAETEVVSEGRSDEDCASTSDKRRQWTREEDQRLSELVEKLGPRRWAQIAQHFKGRTSKQCHQRWHYCLKPDITRTGWTEVEDAAILELHSLHGNKWTKIARDMPTNRTGYGVRNRYNALLRQTHDGGAEKPCNRRPPKRLRPAPAEEEARAGQAAPAAAQVALAAGSIGRGVQEFASHHPLPLPPPPPPQPSAQRLAACSRRAAHREVDFHQAMGHHESSYPYMEGPRARRPPPQPPSWVPPPPFEPDQGRNHVMSNHIRPEAYALPADFPPLPLPLLLPEQRLFADAHSESHHYPFHYEHMFNPAATPASY